LKDDNKERRREKDRAEPTDEPDHGAFLGRNDSRVENGCGDHQDTQARQE